MLQMSEPHYTDSEETLTIREHLAAVETMEQLIKLQYEQINNLREQKAMLLRKVESYERFAAQVGKSLK